MSIKT